MLNKVAFANSLGPEGGGRGRQPARAVPLPGRGGLAELLSRQDEGTEGRGRGAQAEAGATEKGTGGLERTTLNAIQSRSSWAACGSPGGPVTSSGPQIMWVPTWHGPFASSLDGSHVPGRGATAPHKGCHQNTTERGRGVLRSPTARRSQPVSHGRFW
jgi:hypothetical protein